MSKSISGDINQTSKGDSPLLKPEISIYLLLLKILGENIVFPELLFIFNQPAVVKSLVDVIDWKSSSIKIMLPPTNPLPQSKNGGSHLSVFVKSMSEGLLIIVTKNSDLKSLDKTAV